MVDGWVDYPDWALPKAIVMSVCPASTRGAAKWIPQATMMPGVSARKGALIGVTTERVGSRGVPFLIPPLAVICVAAVLSRVALQGRAIESASGNDRSPGSPISMIFTPEIQYWSASIQDWAAADDIDPNLLAVVMQIESCGDPSARSSAGAIGLFQVMPDHFLPSENPFSPDTNANRALDYLKRALGAAEGNAGLALAGYNAGIGVIGSPDWDWPAETERYMYWGTGIYADAESGGSQSPRLAEWLAAGGQALCRSARRTLQIEG